MNGKPWAQKNPLKWRASWGNGPPATVASGQNDFFLSGPASCGHEKTRQLSGFVSQLAGDSLEYKQPARQCADENAQSGIRQCATVAQDEHATQHATQHTTQGENVAQCRILNCVAHHFPHAAQTSAKVACWVPMKAGRLSARFHTV